MEITIDPKFNQPDLNQIEMHSFHNIMTVIYGELQFLKMVLGDDRALARSLAICDEFTGSIRDRLRAREFVRDWDKYKEKIWHEIQKAVADHPVKDEHTELIQKSFENLTNIFKVVDARVKELLTGEKGPLEWVTISKTRVAIELKQVLDAMARNSRGRYGIVYEQSQKGEKDYLIKITIEGGSDGRIHTPLFLLDALRDLTANARKYTKPGGRITSSLIVTEAGLELTVTDNGRGIPQNEIEKVVDFGFRGSNTDATETKGGGYGLTKAYYFCKLVGGRMWIDSELDVGTTVKLFIPYKGNG